MTAQSVEACRPHAPKANPGRAAGLAALAAIFAGGPAQAQPPLALKLPDLAAYDCALSTQPPTGATLRTVHIGQVIKGRYAEWNEYWLTPAGAAAAQLVCISHIAPKARSLSAQEAARFLRDSFAIGTPAPQGAGAEAAAVEEAAPERVPPEPVKHVLRPPASREQAQPEAAQSIGVDTPPVPATRSIDPASPDNTPPAGRRASTGTAAAGTTAPAQTVGVEDRTQVTSTTAFPWNTVGYLLVTYPNGASYRCSGTLVSPYVVLTAGHCIHNNTRGGYVSAARFYPGQYQPTSGGTVVRPYGGHADWQNLKTTQTWTQISGSDSYPVTDYQSDFAAVQFQTAFTHTTTFMPVVFADTTATVTNGGYPAIVNGLDTYTPFTESAGELSTYLRASHVREFGVDSSGGNSGGPFWRTDATGRPGLVGSLSYGDDLNNRSGGPWYDTWNQALIKDWITWTPNGVEVAQNSASGLRMASVFSSAQTDSQSFIRLYNPTAAAGTVAVTLADYATGSLLGTWTSPPIPAGASLQYAVSTLESGATTPITAPPAFYSLSVRPSFNGYFQHVLWRSGDGSITDLTTCDSKSTTDPTILMNVHSSILKNGYPSTIIVQNTGTAAASVTLGIYDARNGARLGGYTTPFLQPNAQDIRTVAYMESIAGISPSAGMYHYVIKAETPFTGYLQHLVRNDASGVITDMSPFCQMASQ